MPRVWGLSRKTCLYQQKVTFDTVAIGKPKR